MKRAIFDAILAVSIFFFPALAPAIFSYVGIYFFRNFYEAILAGVVLDFVYGFEGFRWWYSVIAIAVFISLSEVKKRIRA